MEMTMTYKFKEMIFDEANNLHVAIPADLIDGPDYSDAFGREIVADLTKRLGQRVEIVGIDFGKYPTLTIQARLNPWLSPLEKQRWTVRVRKALK